MNTICNSYATYFIYTIRIVAARTTDHILFFCWHLLRSFSLRFRFFFFETSLWSVMWVKFMMDFSPLLMKFTTRYAAMKINFANEVYGLWCAGNNLCSVSIWWQFIHRSHHQVILIALLKSKLMVQRLYINNNNAPFFLFNFTIQLLLLLSLFSHKYVQTNNI